MLQYCTLWFIQKMFQLINVIITLSVNLIGKTYRLLNNI